MKRLWLRFCFTYGAINPHFWCWFGAFLVTKTIIVTLISSINRLKMTAVKSFLDFAQFKIIERYPHLDIFSYSGCAPEHHLAEIPESFGLFKKFGFRFLILSSYVWLFLLFFMFVWSPYRTDNIFKWATHVTSRDISAISDPACFVWSCTWLISSQLK